MRDYNTDPTNSTRPRSDVRRTERGSGKPGEMDRPGPGTGSRVLTGMFRDRDSAERAYNLTQERGYSPEDINLFMSKDTRERMFSDDRQGRETEMGSKTMEGTGAGATIGGGVGAVAGIIAAVGTSIAVPGLGLVISGPIAAGLAGAGAGGITGGLIGALVGAGIPKETAKTYESGLNEGHLVMSVTPRNEADGEFLENEWRANKGEEVHW